MPLKLRKHDLDLISEQLTEDEPNVQSGTVSDVIKLVPAPRITKDGRALPAGYHESLLTLILLNKQS